MFNNRENEAEEQISYLEYRAMKLTLMEQQSSKKKKKGLKKVK